MTSSRDRLEEMLARSIILRDAAPAMEDARMPPEAKERSRRAMNSASILRP
jgi:hypothetical protein